jgi:fatty acid desaturase
VLLLGSFLLETNCLRLPLPLPLPLLVPVLPFRIELLFARSEDLDLDLVVVVVAAAAVAVVLLVVVVVAVALLLFVVLPLLRCLLLVVGDLELGDLELSFRCNSRSDDAILSTRFFPMLFVVESTHYSTPLHSTPLHSLLPTNTRLPVLVPVLR